MDQLKTLLSSRRFETFITALIVINAITLGLETVPEVMQRFGVVLTVLDRVILASSW
jgi:voltage-gated sodium channel